MHQGARVPDAPPTIRSIAKACGYSHSTVSRALTNKSSIPTATREKILKTAKSLGWKPNPLVAAYVAHRRASGTMSYQATLAYLLTNEDLTDFPRNGYIYTHLQGAKARGKELGYVIEPLWFRDVDYNVDRMSRMIRSRGIPGVIIPHIQYLKEDDLTDFDWSSFAVATSGFTITKPGLARSGFYWSHGVRLALKRIEEYGYRHVGLVMSEYHEPLSDYSLSSEFYHREKNTRPGELYQSYIVPESTKDVIQSIQEWLIEHHPQVVIGFHDTWLAISRLNWRIPDDIAFVSPHWSSPWPQIAGINQCWEAIGANAVELVVTQLNANERGIPTVPRHLLNEGYWVDGESFPRLS